MTPRSDDPLAALVEDYARTRDSTVRDEVVLASMDLVEHIAQRYRYAGEPLEDIIQEGTIGLINSVEMFDPSRGVKFATYASHAVQGAIQHYLRDKGKLIREPGWLHDLNQKINKARARLHHDFGREPTIAELAADLDVPDQQVAEVMRSRDVFKVSSLEQPANEESDTGLAPAEREPARGRGGSAPAEGDDVALVDRLALEEAIGQLRQVEREVVYDFFFNEMSKTEIARRLGYSSSHVAHLLRRALRQLRDTWLADERDQVRRQLRSLEGQLADIERRVAEETIKDDLTGLFNRRYLLERLDEELSRSQRYGTLLSVVMVEIDGLARYREAYGEAEADRALCLIAEILTQASRRIDRLARYDDARFLLLLPNTGEQATVLCNRIRDRVEAYRFRRTPTPSAARLRAASGIAVCPQSGQDPTLLLRAADEALADALTGAGDGVKVHRPSAAGVQQQ